MPRTNVTVAAGPEKGRYFRTCSLRYRKQKAPKAKMSELDCASSVKPRSTNCCQQMDAKRQGTELTSSLPVVRICCLRGTCVETRDDPEWTGAMMREGCRHHQRRHAVCAGMMRRGTYGGVVCTGTPGTVVTHFYFLSALISHFQLMFTRFKRGCVCVQKCKSGILCQVSIIFHAASMLRFFQFF